MDRKFFLPVLAFCLSCSLGAQERPLASLPYTPSLEPAFLNRSADPCVDFFQFACGNWIKLNPIPADQARWDVYAKLGNDNMRFLWGLLEETAKPAPGRTPSQQKIGDYFAACMDEAAIEKAGAAPLRKTLDEIAALKGVADLAPLLARLHLESAHGALFDFGSNQDYRRFQPGHRVRRGRRPGPAGPRLLREDRRQIQETRARYLEHVATMLELLGDPAAAAKRRGADRHGHRDRAGQGLAHARGAARPLQAVSQVDARRNS